ncbi:MAG: alginate lyase family protein [Devosia sp.]|nr:alginate lyase family protein [Devosia sp.]
MSLSWYVNRLRGMGPREAGHRLVAKLKQERSRRRHEGWHRFERTGSGPLPLPGVRAAVSGASAEERAAIAAAAAAVLGGRFCALGQEWPRRETADLFPRSVWRLDPVTGGAWPGADAYCFDIDYRHTDTLGDIKYVWEFNRLQMLQPLAAHALLSGDEASVQAIDRAIASWHEANPPFRGVGWSSGIEVALRAISLIFAASLVGDALRPATMARLRAILSASVFWLDRFPSRFSSANNHLTAELAGTYLIAWAMPDLPNMISTRAAARENLVAETLKQILRDGVGAEQSPSYAAFSVELLLLCATVARESGTPFPDEAVSRLGRFAEFAGWITSASGTTVPIGDDDEGRAITLCQPEQAYVASVAAAAAAFAGGPSAPPALPQLRNLLLGKPATRPGAGASSGLRTFEAGGYTVWRGGCNGRELHLVFDHGPLGYLSIAAHAHADALSMMLSVDGLPVLVDPGTYLYQSGGVWRDWFRGTRAHNTLGIGGADQSLISGPFNWSHKAVARLDEVRDGDNWFAAASHDGYEKRFGVRHQRTLEKVPEGLAITDRLFGSGAPQVAEVPFQLAPDLRAELDGRMVSVSRAGAPVVRLEFPSPRIVMAAGGEPGAGGWVSPGFGLKLPSVRISWRGPVGPDGVRVSVLI